MLFAWELEFTSDTTKGWTDQSNRLCSSPLTAFQGDGDGEVSPCPHQLAADLQRVCQVDARCQTHGVQAERSLIVTPRLLDARLVTVVHEDVATGDEAVQEEWLELQALGESRHCFLQAPQSEHTKQLPVPDPV